MVIRLKKKINKNKIAVVTGASRGIGKDLAKIYLKKGHIVFGCSRKNSNLKHKNYVYFIKNAYNAIRLLLRSMKSLSKWR